MTPAVPGIRLYIAHRITIFIEDASRFSEQLPRRVESVWMEYKVVSLSDGVLKIRLACRAFCATSNVAQHAMYSELRVDLMR